MELVSENQVAERSVLTLPILGHRLEANVVSDERAPELARTFQEGVIWEIGGTIILRGEDIDASEAQLGGDGVIDVDVEVEPDRHLAPAA
jgi:hypothetical protein